MFHHFCFESSGFIEDVGEVIIHFWCSWSSSTTWLLCFWVRNLILHAVACSLPTRRWVPMVAETRMAVVWLYTVPMCTPLYRYIYRYIIKCISYFHLNKCLWLRVVMLWRFVLEVLQWLKSLTSRAHDCKIPVLYKGFGHKTRNPTCKNQSSRHPFRVIIKLQLSQCPKYSASSQSSATEPRHFRYEQR